MFNVRENVVHSHDGSGFLWIHGNCMAHEKLLCYLCLAASFGQARWLNGLLFLTRNVLDRMKRMNLSCLFCPKIIIYHRSTSSVIKHTAWNTKQHAVLAMRAICSWGKHNVSSSVKKKTSPLSRWQQGIMTTWWHIFALSTLMWPDYPASVIFAGSCHDLVTLAC